MTKKAIIQIIVLMSSALVGIMGMQIYYVYTTLALHYEVFDNNIHAVLAETVAKLEQAEIEQTSKRYNLPKPTMIKDAELNGVARVAIDEIAMFMPDRQATHSDKLSEDEYKNLEKHFKVYETRRTWKKGSREVFHQHFERFFVHHSLVQDIPIQKRLSLGVLDTILKSELQEKGFDIPYVYGVYARAQDTFVLTNQPNLGDKHNSVGGQASLAVYKKLDNFRYSIGLFPTAGDNLAILAVDFPSRNSLVWAGLGLNLVGTLILIGIIIFCFLYTIKIILNQKKMSEMKTDFLNNMTHEFKTPIATISIATDMIRSLVKNQKTEQAERFIQIIKTENQRMNNQVEQVLQIARMEKQDFELNMQPVDVQQVVEKAVASITLQVEQKQGRIQTNLGNEPLLISADLTHLTNAVMNLLDNANKYSPQKPDITVVARKSYPSELKKGVWVEISDKGLGISKEAQLHVFDSFYRVHTGNLHDIKGFGLGLSYVKGVVTAHKGEVLLKSELGKGSTFSLFFPENNGE